MTANASPWTIHPDTPTLRTFSIVLRPYQANWDPAYKSQFPTTPGATGAERVVDQLAERESQLQEATRLGWTLRTTITLTSPINGEITVIDTLSHEPLMMVPSDDVPIGAIVRSAAGTIACRYDNAQGIVFGDERPFPWSKLADPVQIIWQPGQTSVRGGEAERA